MTPRPWSAPWRPLAAAAAASLGRARGRPRWAAVVEDGSGMLHAGVSVAVADLPAASLCAEQIAIAGLYLEGDRKVRRIVLVGPPPLGAAPPCGRCLQLLHELEPSAAIRWGTARVERGRSTVARLLPSAFGDYRTV